jgi:hypothetical protein
MELVALRDAMGAVMPGPLETSLLRACLLPGDAGREAWQRFERASGDLRELFRADHGSRKRLGPLLAWALRRNAIPADPALLTVLRTSHLREELRAEIYGGILSEVLGRLEALDMRVLVLGGAAFGSTLYEAPVLRHSHDIDLLVEEGVVERAAEALASQGFRRTGASQLEHRRSLPVNLHRRLLAADDGEFSFELVWSRSVRATIGDRSGFVLSTGDSLFQVLGRAALSPNRRSLQWACDARLLTDRMGDRDWEVFLEQVATSRVALWSWVMLDYLARALGAGVPGTVSSAIQGLAAHAGAEERDLALYAARADSGTSGMQQVLRGSSAAARARLLAWLLFPSPGYMRSAYGSRSSGRLPAMYLRRLLSYAARSAS